MTKESMTQNEWEAHYGMPFGSTAKSPKEEAIEKRFSETQAIFAEYERINLAQAEQIAALKDALKNIEDRAAVELGEWYGVEYGHLPIVMSGWWMIQQEAKLALVPMNYPSPVTK
jgi:hypothetical protein